MRKMVTVGVCVRNSAATLGDAIGSIISQDFPHWLLEVIFVDDGSQDKTLSVIKEYVPKTDFPVKIFKTSWQGLGAARNLVVKNAEGAYIVWVDGDMILPIDYIKNQVEFMEKNPKVGIAKGKYGALKGTKIVADLENIAYMVTDSKASTNPALKLPGTGGSVYRTRAIKQVGGFNEQIVGAGEDLDAAYRVAAAGWLLCSTPIFFYERRRETIGALWREYFWHGYGMHFTSHRCKGVISVLRMSPIASLLTGLLYSRVGYRATHRKMVFLLPIHFAFKMTAWFFGFTKSHLDSYGHRK